MRRNIKYIRYTIQGKGTKHEKKVKLKKPIKTYYSKALKKYITIPDLDYPEVDLPEVKHI